jgi:hypothetical protein
MLGRSTAANCRPGRRQRIALSDRGGFNWRTALPLRLSQILDILEWIVLLTVLSTFAQQRPA